MKKPENIVCLAFPAWDGNYVKSTVQLMTALSMRHHVLYVDYAYTWKDFIYSLFGKGNAPWSRMLHINSPLRLISQEMGGGSLYVLSLPPVIPSNFLQNPIWYDHLNACNAFFLRRRIRWAMKRLGMAQPILVNAFNPFFGIHLNGTLGEKKRIYYCYDEIGAASWAKKHGKRLEQIAIAQSDAVVVTSQGLLDAKKQLHHHCYLIKNGVDFELFARAAENDDKVNALLPPHITTWKKCIGYIGSIDNRLDFVLLEHLATQFPDYLFCFVGRKLQNQVTDQLNKLPNIYFAGAQPPHILSNWIRNFDACLIPFVKNEFTAGIYPMKINEYLAVGKPVIATDFADLSDFDQTIAVAKDHSSFATAMKKVIEDDNEEKRSQRIHFASSNDWSQRAAAFEKVF